MLQDSLNIIKEKCDVLKFKKVCLPVLSGVEGDFQSYIRDIRQGGDSIRRREISGLLIENVNISKVDFEETLLSDCKFKECDFSKAFFADTIIQNCSFTNCVFENLYLKNVWIEESKFIGCNFAGGIIKESVFKEDYFQYANFNGARFEKVFLDYSRILSSELSECKISALELNRAVFNESNFFKTPLKGIDFTTSEITHITLSKDFFELRGATINMFQAMDLVRLLGIKVDM